MSVATFCTKKNRICATNIENNMTLIVRIMFSLNKVNIVLGTDKLTCETCLRQFKNKATLHYHQRCDCGKEKLYKCSKCDYKTKRKFTLNRHYTARHQTLK